MSKVFEDYFSELQADMVSICLEYVENRAQKIFIYCSFEEGLVSSDFFYKVANSVLERHKLNDIVNEGQEKYNIDVDRQMAVMDIINEDIEKIYKLCKEYKREMPTEIKLIYDVDKNSLEGEYKYDIVYSNDPVKTADDIAMEWFEKIQLENSK
ncbi:MULTISPECIES: hypothetical protein [Clostridium]|uniref:hypothetical protein n=1 Tax=Clostridium TaxID=1485 RepID=UPI001D8BD980|nr:MULTISPECIES: hypothetical protein [Clostridium]MBS5308860.1 hypothetical protein [Clostridium sp.]MDB1933168.1 hypothetical protein [Clostridium tertium]MDB1938144.1 hypothetical protein [Clostridium tertium]MDB1944075.1 hypothetical protein [Clostridium tertium]MDB1950761.1 hypothetical protein [Clostridium tertium]